MPNTVTTKTIKFKTVFDDGEISNGLNKVQSLLNNLKLKPNFSADITNNIKRLNEAMTAVQQKMSRGIGSSADLSNINSGLNKIDVLAAQLVKRINSLDLGLDNLTFSPDVQKRIDAFNESIKLSQGHIDQLKESMRKIATESNFGKNNAKALNKAIKQDTDIRGLKLDQSQQEKDFNAAQKDLTNKEEELKYQRLINGTTDLYRDRLAEILSIRKENLSIAEKEAKVRNAMGGFSKEQIAALGLGDNEDKIVNNLARSNGALGKTREIANDKSAAKELDALAAQVEKARKPFNDYMLLLDEIIKKQQRIFSAKQSIDTDTKEVATIVDASIAEVKTKAAEATGDLADATDKQVESGKEANAVAAEDLKLTKERAAAINTLADRLKMYLSITYIFQAIKRVVRDVWNEMKEFDAQFTEIAVVTNKTTQELWGTFETYNKLAQKLGATTSDAIKTSALYYQQGLDTNNVMIATEETMKMAIIANMDFAEATDRMTAAIRGFKLEMTDAAHVNDVFSALAARTATDTDELSIALTKTASIAESAGMGLENTSAFLAQMIETTREAPENIGTAMKTIIARFQELKKNPMNLTIEVDGESVNANKVEEALKTAEVALRDTVTGQFRDLDDVFLELSDTWDTLDRNTQRYIATMAAGSRQQSRFLALMSDNARLTELIGIAQDSENQSTIQFAKTLDSIESKLNKLKTAWADLYTKFLNSELFKGIIDGIRSFADGLSRLSPEVILGLGVAFVTLGKAIINNLKGSLGESSLAWDKLKGQIVKGVKTFLKLDTTQAEADLNAFKTKAQQPIVVSATVPANVKNGGATSTFLPPTALDPNRDEAQKTRAYYTNQQAKAQGRADFKQRLFDPSSLTNQVATAVGLGMASGLTMGIATGDWKTALTTALTVTASSTLTSLLPKITGAIADVSKFGGLSAAFSAAVPAAQVIEGSTIATSTAVFATVGWVLLIVAAVAGLGYVLWKLLDPVQQATRNLEKQEKLYDKLTEKSEKLNATYLSDKDKVKNLVELKDTYEELTSKVVLTEEEQEKLNDTISNVSEIAPELIKGYDEQGNAILKQADAWQEVIDNQKESLELTRRQAAEAGLATNAQGIEVASAQGELDYIKTHPIKAEELPSASYSSDTSLPGFTELAWASQTTPSGYDPTQLPAYQLAMTKFTNSIKQIVASANEDLQDAQNIELGNTITGFANTLAENTMKQAYEKGTYGSGEDFNSATFTTDLENKVGEYVATFADQIQHNPTIEGKLQELGENMSIMTQQELSDAFANLGFTGDLSVGTAMYNQMYASFTEANEARDELANTAVALIAQAFNDVAVSSEMFQRLGYNFTAGFTSAFAEALPAARAEMLYDIKEFYSGIQAQANSADIFKAVQATDFSNMNSIDLLVGQMDELGYSTEDARDMVYDLAASLEGVNFSKNILTANEMMEQYGNTLEGVINTYDKLNSAYTEQQKNGKMSVKTILELIKAGQWEMITYNKNAKTVAEAFTIKKDAAQDAANAEIDAAIQSLSAEAIKTESAIESLTTQKALLDAEIANLAAHGGATTELETMIADSALSIQAAQLTAKDENAASAAQTEEDTMNASGTAYADYVSKIAALADKESKARIAGKTGAPVDTSATWDSVSVAKAGSNDYKTSTGSFTGTMGTGEMRAAEIDGDITSANKSKYKVMTQKDYNSVIMSAKKMSTDLQTQIDALTGQHEKQQSAIEAMKGLKDLLGGELFSGSDGKGGGGGKEAYKTTLEKFYNILKQIEYWQNKIENLESKRSLLTNFEDIADNLVTSEQSMRNLIATYEKAIPLYKAEVDGIKLLAETTYKGYLSFINDDVLQINYDAITQLSEEQQKAIEETVSTYDEASKALDEYTNAILEQKKAIKDLAREYRDKYTDLEEKIVEVLKNIDQKELDELTKKYDKMKEADDDYLESLKKNLDARRKARERDDSTKELTDLQKKLNLLKRDTSGVYALDILKLEQEIADKRTSIADTATDDYISDLEERYAAEAELRQNEIDAMQEALDQKLENMTEYWEEVDAIMDTGYEGIMSFLMQYDEEFNQGSAAMRESWLEDWDLAINEALAYLDALASGFGSLTGSVLSDIFQMSGALSDLTNQMASVGSVGGGSSGGGSTPPPSGSKTVPVTYDKYYYDATTDSIHSRRTTIQAPEGTSANDLSEASRQAAIAAAEAASTKPTIIAKKGGSGGGGTVRRTEYHKGGLADYTGPAWVDGTKRDPEAFLDPEDTRNVATLRDELRKMNLSKTHSLAQNEGNQKSVTVNMEIYVDQLASELDVKDLVEDVRQDILKASQYRNNVEVTIKR